MKLNRFTIFAISAGVASVVGLTSAQQAPPNPKDPAHRPQGRAPRRGHCGPEHGAAGEHAEARRILQFRRPRPGRRRRPSARRARRPSPPPSQARRRPRRRAARASRTPTSPSSAPTWWSATIHGFNIYDVENVRKPRADRPRSSAPAGRATSRCGATCCSCRWSRPAGASTAACRACTETVSKERFRGVRIFDISDLRKPRQVAAVQTCRGSHTHTLVPDPNDTVAPVRLRLRHRLGAPGRGARGLLGARPERGSEHRALQHRRDRGAARRARRTRRSSTGPRIFADEKTGNLAGLWQGGNHGEGTQTSRMTNQCHDITVFPEHRPGRRRLLGQRHPDGHLRSGAPEAARPRRRQELRLLALGDVQQRRHQGDLHRRVGRRHAAALPRHRSASPGAPTPSSTSSTRSCSSRATTRCRRRRPTRRTASRTTAR